MRISRDNGGVEEAWRLQVLKAKADPTMFALHTGASLGPNEEQFLELLPAEHPAVVSAIASVRQVAAQSGVTYQGIVYPLKAMRLTRVVFVDGLTRRVFLEHRQTLRDALAAVEASVVHEIMELRLRFPGQAAQVFVTHLRTASFPSRALRRLADADALPEGDAPFPPGPPESDGSAGDRVEEQPEEESGSAV